MKKKYRGLLVGLGNIGMGYDLHLSPRDGVLSHASALKNSERFEFLGAVDSDGSKRETFEALYHLPAYATIGEALKEFDIDVAIVATPTQLHLKSIEELTKSGLVKSILCEKPISYSLAEAKKIFDLCSSKNCKLYVNYMRRADPGVNGIKLFLEENPKTLPCKGVAWYSKGLIHNGSHLVDILKLWLGDIVGYKLISKGPANNNGNDCEPDVLIHYQDGDIVFLSCNEEHYSHHTIELISPLGRLGYEAGGFNAYWQNIVADKDYSSYKVLSPTKNKFDCQMNFSQLNLINEWANCIDTSSRSLCSGEEAIKMLEYLNDIRRVSSE